MSSLETYKRENIGLFWTMVESLEQTQKIERDVAIEEAFLVYFDTIIRLGVAYMSVPHSARDNNFKLDGRDIMFLKELKENLF